MRDCVAISSLPSLLILDFSPGLDALHTVYGAQSVHSLPKLDLLNH